MKRIAIFIDGTWNRPDAKFPTNVVRLARCVKHFDSEMGIGQHVIYSPGVGSGRGNTWLGRKMDRLFGGALGWGLMDIIEDTYRNLVFCYEPGDEIYIFGFSRGAFAARSLAGLIRSCGICPQHNLHMIPEAMARYISRDADTKPDDPASILFRQRFAPDTATSDTEFNSRKARGDKVIKLTIDYVGVWDTVKAIGLPAFLPFTKRFNDKYKFHDDKLSRSVLSARHAVAADEMRMTFPALPWGNVGTLNGDNDDMAPRYLQQWFPGNHGSIGGGGEIQGLSNVTLHWIAQGAERAGLAIHWDEMDVEGEHRDPVHESLENKRGSQGLAAILNLLKVSCNGPKETEALSVAGLDRLEENTAYRPQTMNFVLDEVQHRPKSEVAALRDWLVARDGGPTHEKGSFVRPRHWEPPRDAAQFRKP